MCGKCMGTFLGWSVKRPSNLTKLLLLTCASVGLMALDAGHDRSIKAVRGWTGAVTYPAERLAALPLSAWTILTQALRSNEALRRENARLVDRDAILQAKVARLAALKAEFAHLNLLLKGFSIPGYRVTIARILDASSGPFTQRLILDEGRNGSVYVGQAVIDGHGVLGQVVAVHRDTSQVMLVTDPDSGVPVISTRDGLRAIVFGAGSNNPLKVPYLTGTADIHPGDVLVTSGLGGIFPAGYPVARVTQVSSNPNLAFLKVRAIPLSRLDYHTHVLLLWPRKPTPIGGPAR